MASYRPLADREADENGKSVGGNDQIPLLPVDLDEQAQGTIMASVANLSNTILGTGMLAMPHAVSHTRADGTTRD